MKKWYGHCTQLIQNANTLLYCGDAFQENITLSKLNLAMNGISTPGVRHLCELLQINSTLRDLDLTATRITNDAAFLLGKMLEKNESLQILRVREKK